MNKLVTAIAMATAMFAAFWALTQDSDANAATGIAGSLKGSISDLPASPRLPVEPAAFQVPAPLSPYNDPYHPSYNTMWCPGGGLGGEGNSSWCDGVDYPDGTFWHQSGYLMYGLGFRVVSACKQHTPGSIWLQDAPASGCGGEA